MDAKFSIYGKGWRDRRDVLADSFILGVLGGWRQQEAVSGLRALAGREAGHSWSHQEELAAATATSARPELGMIDCGATASAAPDAIVKGLVSSILECDCGAGIDIDQSARPYFRFGNGRWGRALYSIHISSDVSGVNRKFSLFALPNPSEFYEVNFDKSTLVPVLVGMDFLGTHGGRRAHRL